MCQRNKKRSPAYQGALIKFNNKEQSEENVGCIFF